MLVLWGQIQDSREPEPEPELEEDNKWAKVLLLVDASSAEELQSEPV